MTTCQPFGNLRIPTDNDPLCRRGGALDSPRQRDELSVGTASYKSFSPGLSGWCRISIGRLTSNRFYGPLLRAPLPHAGGTTSSGFRRCRSANADRLRMGGVGSEILGGG